ncbi:hypothetical protein VHEMI05624 [[Torrubiella] hemipterigena]|uniref:Copper acquisition factor BIM1-like domain-containing protein n=1 Tax=[Torrubiella] hemipterigena TaxID=1531966 RepID=A0A0A1TH43_9HYPO|nr:hypothetical protein VHEMI05624 [[Torrubiella] hemipterigena]
MHALSVILPFTALLAGHASAAAFDNMGPAAFLSPPDRPWSPDADNTAPCGSDSGPVNRTQFPMRNGKVAFVAQDESYDIELRISYKSDPKSDDDFTQLISAAAFREMDMGHTCVNVADAPAAVQPGSNATFQIKYIADFDKPQNQTFYACADITYVSAIANLGSSANLCFNATEPSTGKNKPTNTPVPGNNSGQSSGGGGLSGGAIAGIVIGSLAGVAFVGAGAFMVYRRKQRRLNAARQAHTARGVKWDNHSARDSASQGSVRLNDLSRN